MRSYDVTATALALGVHRKWIDNVLSHHQLDGVDHTRQGIRRRLAPAAVLVLAIALDLHRALGLPLARSLEVATQIAAGDGSVRAGRNVALEVDVVRLQGELAERLGAAAEAAPPRRRGRPPMRARRSSS